jgi:hypothetical protein
MSSTLEKLTQRYHQESDSIYVKDSHRHTSWESDYLRLLLVTRQCMGRAAKVYYKLRVLDRTISRLAGDRP